LQVFAAEYPGTQVTLHDLSSEECRQKLAARKLDLALTIQPPGATKGLRYEPIASHSVLCAVGSGHPLAARRGVSLKQLAGEPFVAYTEEDYPEYMAWLWRVCRAAGFRPNIVGEYDGATGLITAVESGRGIALVAATLGCLSGPRLAYVALRPRIPPLGTGAVFPVTASNLTENFIRVVKKVAASTRAEAASPGSASSRNFDLVRDAK
jgi:DNA-binding transcriptional LysR family regulator